MSLAIQRELAIHGSELDIGEEVSRDSLFRLIAYKPQIDETESTLEKLDSVRDLVPILDGLAVRKLNKRNRSLWPNIASTFAHSQRVSVLASLIERQPSLVPYIPQYGHSAEAMFIPCGNFIEDSPHHIVLENRSAISPLLSHASELHDIGKLGVSYLVDADKKLNDAELKIVRLHPIIGYVLFSYLELPLFVSSVALGHHMRYDGQGSPFEEDIPHLIKIVCDDYNLPLPKHTNYQDIMHATAVEFTELFKPKLFLASKETYLDDGIALEESIQSWVKFRISLNMLCDWIDALFGNGRPYVPSRDTDEILATLLAGCGTIFHPSLASPLQSAWKDIVGIEGLSTIVKVSSAQSRK
jgi:hypothetical protein